MRTNIRFKTLMLVVTGLIASAGLVMAVSTDGTATFRVSTKSYSGAYSPNHVLAIWVTDAQTNFVKTLKRQAATRIRYLYQWGDVSKSNVVDAITGATLGSHQTHTLTWNCRDVSNVVVPDGTYRFYVEFTEDNGQGPWTSTSIVSFVKGGSSVTSYPPSQANFTNMMIVYIPASIPNSSIPGTLQAEDYSTFSDTTVSNQGGVYRSDDVDIEACVEGGYDVGWIAAGEWLGFVADVATTGVYDLRFRVSSGVSGAKSLHVEVDGTNVTGAVTFDTGGAGWQVWTNAWASNITLNAGARQVRVVMDTADFNFNYMAVTPTPVHDIAVDSIVSGAFIPPGSVTDVVVVVTNRGNYTESFTVALTNLTDHVLIGSRSATGLPAGGRTNVAFTWNTATSSTGYHQLVASAGPVAGETRTTDNVMTGSVLLAQGIATNKIILKGSTWRYQDEGLNLSGTPWREASYYDGHWAAGAAVLGFGNGGEATVLANPASATNALNLLNASFELAGVGGASFASNWNGEAQNGVIMGGSWGGASRESWRAHSGSWQGTVHDWGASGIGAGFWQQVTNNLGPGSIWTAGIWAWNDNGQSGIYFTNASGKYTLKIEWYDAAQQLISQESAGISLPGEVWTRGTVQGVAPAGTVWVRFIVGVEAMSAGGSLQFDDATLTGTQAGRTTWYFRRDAYLDATPLLATVNLRRDDGVALYVNGTEVMRDGLPTNALTSATTATNAVYGGAETNYISRSINPSALRSGRNVVAAEVHQAPGAYPMVSSVWINEIHYDNTGTDTNEGVEVAGAAGTDLAAYRLLMYDGGANIYRTNALTGILPNQTNGCGALWFSIVGMQNGPADGVALVRWPTGVVQLLSYEGVFTASVGAAAGMVATDIGVSEASTTPLAQSLQLVGTGVEYSAFSWSGPATSSTNALNSAQVIPSPEAADLAYDLELVTVVPVLALQHQVGITALDAPDNLLSGDQGVFHIGVTNAGQAVETFTVVLVDTNTGVVVGSRVVSNLVAGGVTEVQFLWSTLGVSSGTHGLAAYTVLGGVTNYAGVANAATTFSGAGFGLNAVNATGSIGGRCSAVAASGNVLVVGVGATLEVWDRTSPLAPAKVGALRLPGMMEAVVINGSYAYAACGAAGVQFVDISTPARPVHVNSFDSSGDARALACSGNYLYVADGIAGLRIINIANPLSPSLAGAWYSTGPAISVAAASSRAYVMDEYAGLLILDVSSPAAPSLLGTYSGLTAARGLALSGNTAVIADDNGKLSLINVATPSAPTLSGSLNLGAFSGSIAATGSVAYVAAGDAGLLTINLAGPSVAHTNATADAALAVTLAGSSVTIASSYAGVQTFDVSSPLAPSLQGTYPAGYRVSDVAVNGPLAYIAAGERGLQIFSISNAAMPVALGSVLGIGNARSIGLSGGLAVVGDGISGARVVSVTNPAAPYILGTFTSTNLVFVRSAAVSGSRAAVTDGRHILLLDLSSPSLPTQLGEYLSDGYVFDLAMNANHVFAAAGGDGLRILSVPALSPVGLYDTAGMAVAVTLDGTKAHVADGAEGWVLLDVSAPAAPALVNASAGQGPVDDVAVSAYLATYGGSSALLEAMDISTPLTPVSKSSLGRVTRILRLAASGPYVLTAEDDAGLGLFDAVPDDHDLDRMSDAWEQQIADANLSDAIFGPADVLPGDDFDGDGLSNYGEFVAGTDARDSQSVFAATVPAQPSGASFVVHWHSVAGRTYTLYRSVDLTQGFSPIATGLGATAPMNSYTDTVSSVTSAYYMVGVKD
ncbi:MAG TPA: DUF2271 domain-containing protein [Kiritimatiellia bacterium]|nr:DUF2271 domain-containing protein [Kiritimatiellia bacterium]